MVIMADIIRTIDDNDDIPDYSEESDEEVEVCTQI